ncbi:MAG: MurR/RpiR family transcriptional regulator [Planctomycetaceae bacterium]|nr:MurR/RpiR family transcriptional regulator [Planctomycetaceae bacterium]
MDADVMGKIRIRYKSLSASQKQVADYVVKHPEKVMLLSLADLAAACRVSEPTVMRFLHKLGYQSYQVFRVNVAQKTARHTGESLYDDVNPGDDSRQIMQKVICSTKTSLDDLATVLSPDALEETAEHILSAKTVTVIGVGATHAIAFDLAHKLLKLGIMAQCYNDPHLINIGVGGLDAESLLIAFSHSGESREILDGVAIAKKRGCPVAAVCSFPNSSLAKAADITILSSSHETTYRSDDLTSRILQLCIIDILYIRLALLGGDGMLARIQDSRLAVAKNKT